MSAIDRLLGLQEQCEVLPDMLDRRRSLLREMRPLGLRIDAAYASFVKSLKSAADRQFLARTQSEIQSQIEQLRTVADGIMTQWWDVQRAVGAQLALAARTAPLLLSALEDFARLPTPDHSTSDHQVLRLKELVQDALHKLAPVESGAALKKSNETPRADGFLTAKQIAAALGISDKTIYRLAKQGRIPYVRIQSSLRFRPVDVEAWLESKSFHPAGTKKATPGKRIVSNAPSVG